MKNFFNLFLLNLKDMWQSHRFVFIIINLFMFFSFSFFLISYNICSHQAASGDNTTYIESTFIYRIDSLEDIETKLDKFIKKTKNIRCVYFSFRNNADETISKNFNERNESTNKYEDEIYVLYYGDFVTFNPYANGRWFTDSEMQNGNKVIVAPNYIYMKSAYHISDDLIVDYKINDEYVINDEVYTVIGQNSFIEYVFVIPYNSLTDKSMITNLHISTMDPYNETGNRNFDKNVKKYFDVETNKFATPINPKTKQVIEVVYFIMFNISIINIVYIYFYLLGQRKTMVGLFKIYGMKESKCRKYLLLEYLIWLLFNFVISVIFSTIFVAVAKYLFNQPFIFLAFKDYLLFLSAFIVLYLICFLPIINSYIDRFGKFNSLVEEN